MFMPKDRKGTYEAILLRIIENKRKIEITPLSQWIWTQEWTQCNTATEIWEIWDLTFILKLHASSWYQEYKRIYLELYLYFQIHSVFLLIALYSTLKPVYLSQLVGRFQCNDQGDLHYHQLNDLGSPFVRSFMSFGFQTRQNVHNFLHMLADSYRNLFVLPYYNKINKSQMSMNL